MQGGTNLANKILFYRSRIIAVVIALVIVVVGYNFLSRGYIDVSVQTNGVTTIEVTNQESGSVESVTNSTGNFKKLLPAGDYLVIAKNGDKSFAQLVSNKNLLRTTKVSGGVNAEKSRSFVGNNPKSCYQYLMTVLASYSCDNTFDSAVIHLPATSSIPSYTTSPTSRFVVKGAVSEGVKTTEGLLLLGTNQNKNALYTLGDQLEVIAVRDLNVEAGKTYRLTPYGESVAIYSTDLKKVYTIGTSNADTVEKTVKVTEDTSFQPREVVAQGDNFASVSVQKDEKLKKSQIIITNTAKNSSKTWQFDSELGSVRFCGDSRLCVIDEGKLRVLDANSGNPKDIYVVRDVTDFATNGKMIFAVNKDRVLAIDSTSGVGQIDFALSGFEYNSIKVSQGNYLLNLRDGKGSTFTLLIDREKDDTNSIDKKVYALSTIPGIESLSVYGNYIYLTSRSRLVFKPGFGFTYDEAEKKAIDDAINQKASELQIDRNVFTIKNLANPSGEVSE